MIDWSDLRVLYIEKDLSTPLIAEIKGCTPGSVLYQLRRQGITIKQRNWRRMRHPCLQPSPALSYLLGALLGDGWVSRTSGCVCLKVTSKVFAEQVAETYATINLTGNVWQDKRGFWNATCKSLPFTTWWHSTHDFRKAELALHYRDQFILGLFDAEGSAFQRAADKTPRISIDCGRGDVMGAALGVLYGYGYDVTSWVSTTLHGTEVRRISIQRPDHVSRFLVQFPSRVKTL